MSVTYRAVNWNAHKRVYDLTVIGGAVALVGVFVAAGMVARRGEHAISDEILLIRGLGVCGIVLLHVVLCIGPLARLDARFAPLLYNRRHLGVVTFLVALAHAGLSTLYYGGFGLTDPVSAMLTRNDAFASISGFPFEWLGAAALAILFLMAATSHDFWLANLGPRAWKWLHMLVYAAYGLLVMHVVLGVLQSERSPVYPVLLGAGAAGVAGLHVAAGLRERDRRAWCQVGTGRWIDVGAPGEIPPGCAKRVCLPSGERVAVYRHDANVTAITDVCAHQGGPLSEGRIIDGCVTCPWHGYQYLPESGRSPPPYTEKLATYEVRAEGGRILLRPEALEPGTWTPPAAIEVEASEEGDGHGA